MNKTVKVYEKLAALVRSYHYNVKRGVPVALSFREEAEALVKSALPGGSGFDAGTSIDVEASSTSCLVLRTAYHHMDDCGFYSGWTEHVIKVRAVLDWGFSLSVGGRDRNDINDYIGQVFHDALNQETPVFTEWTQARINAHMGK